MTLLKRGRLTIKADENAKACIAIEGIWLMPDTAVTLAGHKCWLSNPLDFVNRTIRLNRRYREVIVDESFYKMYRNWCRKESNEWKS